MEFESTFSFVVIVALLVMSPGPNGALILKTVPVHGRKSGIVNIFGFVTAITVHGLFSVLGLSVILLNSAKAFFIVKMLGAVYLLYIGLRALYGALTGNGVSETKGPAKGGFRPKSLVSAYTEGLLTNLLNPKLSIFYLAAFPQFIDFGAGAWTRASLLISLHVLINFLWFSSLVLFIAKATDKVRSGSLGRLIQGATGAVLIWFGYRLASVKARV